LGPGLLPSGGGRDLPVMSVTHGELWST
jgi:hypothetical protein